MDKEFIENPVEAYEKLKQECDELRTERKNLKWDLENNIQVKNHAMEEINQLKQTLAEIKEISENFIKNVSGRCIATTPMYSVHTQILQKISKCEK